MAADWTDDQIETLRHMHAVGASARLIGKAVGVSRNAVLGKIFRLGLSTPASTIGAMRRG